MTHALLLLTATALLGWQDPGSTPDKPAAETAEAPPARSETSSEVASEAGQDEAGKVEILDLPRHAQWPAIAIGEDGTVHVLWFQTTRRGEGHSSLGNLLYATRAPGDSQWSEPIRVTEEPISVVSPHIALGKHDRPHVCWGSSHPRGFWYTRLDPRRNEFEPPRDVLNSGAVGLELGPALAVDRKGHVYMAWHEGPFAREDRREVYLVYSGDDGNRFTSAHVINPPTSGACGCCTMAVTTDDDGKVYVAFRAAKDRVGRDMILLTSKNHGRSFSAETIDPWQYERCPTAQTFLSRGPDGRVAVAWETEQSVRLADVEHLQQPIDAPGETPQRLAEMAMNDQGETLLVWFDADTRRPTDPLRWVVYDTKGKETARGELKGSPIAAAARPDGTFVIAH